MALCAPVDVLWIPLQQCVEVGARPGTALSMITEVASRSPRGPALHTPLDVTSAASSFHDIMFGFSLVGCRKLIDIMNTFFRGAFYIISCLCYQVSFFF